MKQTVHILGGRGFIGGHLATALERQGHTVTTGTRPADGSPKQEVDHFDQVLRAHDWVVHAACCSTPGSISQDPMAEVEGNLLTLASLVEAMQSRPQSRLLYLSSAGTTYADSRSGRPIESDPR